MSPTPNPDEDSPGGDPWAAFGYLVAGVLFYGAIGVGLSIWLHASYWIPIGILVGAGFGMYLVFARTLLRNPGHVATMNDLPTNHDHSDKAARDTRPASDDRGETA